MVIIALVLFFHEMLSSLRDLEMEKIPEIIDSVVIYVRNRAGLGDPEVDVSSPGVLQYDP